jgi:hypothetical protein
MKKALTQTIIVFVAVNLITAGFAPAQNIAEEESQPASKEAVVAEKKIELERKKAEIEAKVQQQVELVQKQVELVQKQLELQIPNLEVAAPRIPRLGRIPLLGHGGSGAVLVIPAAEMKVEDLAAITEDMTVMSRIFDTKLSQAHLTTGRGIGSIGFDSLLFGRSSGAIETIYLEGYGALFLMKVNVLLSPPPEALEEKETEEEDTDPLWTQMRQEMYAPQEARRRRTDRPEEKYDAEKVEDLKETLIKTLKHAANIRALKPDESVILTVIGKAGQSATSAIGRLYEEGKSRYIITTSRAGTGFSSPTVLTIRAKKSDIDDFANGTLSFDQFSQKILLLSYSYLGENVGGPSRSSPTNVIYGGRSRGSSRSSTSRPR